MDEDVRGPQILSDVWTTEDIGNEDEDVNFQKIVGRPRARTATSCEGLLPPPTKMSLIFSLNIVSSVVDISDSPICIENV